MKKENVFLLFILSCFFLNGFGQADTTSAVNEERKNELHFNIKPLVTIATHGFAYPYFNLMYKRLYDKNAIRISIDYKGANYLDFVVRRDNKVEIVWLDTNRYKTLNDNRDIRSMLGLRIGAEHTWGKKKLIHFSGIDFSYSYCWINIHTSYSEVVITTNPPLTTYTWYGTYDIGTTSFRLSKFAIHPFYGFKYPFTKRFLVSLQFGLEYYFASANEKYYDFDKNINSEKFKEQGFLFDGLLNDISLVYRF